MVRMIAIDGPVASGKTSVGLALAKRLGFLFLDTGVMYRAVAWAVLKNNVNIEDESAVSRLASELKIEIQKPSREDGRSNDIFVNGEDVTWEIRGEKVNNSVSQVSAYREVRKVLTEQQRYFGMQGDVVMVGRDIGTVVLPDADLKIFLKASAEERAKRRFQEEKARGNQTGFEQILKNMKMRDELDSSREVAPLTAAPDAVIIDTDGRTKEEVIEEIFQLTHK